MGMKGEAEMRTLNKRTSARQFLSSAGKIWTRKQKKEAVSSLPSAPWPSLPHPSILLLRGEEVQSEKHSKHPAGTMFIQRVLLAELLRNSPGTKKKGKGKTERGKKWTAWAFWPENNIFLFVFLAKRNPARDSQVFRFEGVSWAGDREINGYLVYSFFLS